MNQQELQEAARRWYSRVAQLTFIVEPADCISLNRAANDYH